MEDDIALLRRYAETGDQPAFAALVERRIDLVYSAALRHLDGVAHRAQDVTQAVFTQLAGNARALAGRDELLGWLYVATHHAAANLKRTESRRQAREAEAHSMQLSSSGTDAEIRWEQLRPILDESMLALPETDRLAILSRYFQNERFATLGSKLGVTADAARMRLDRALEKLRAQLSRRGIRSTSAALSATLTDRVTVAAPAGLAAVVTGTALSGGAGATAVAASTGLLSLKLVAVAGVGLAALGISLYSFNSDAGRSASVATRDKSEAPPQALSSASVADVADRAVATPVATPSASPAAGGMVLVPAPAPSPAAAAPANGGLPQIVLSQVLGPNNLYHDDVFGLSMTYPEGWGVDSARRWGDRNRHNTVVFRLEPETATATGSRSLSSNMYYKLFQPDEAALRDQSPEAYLRKAAADKEALHNSSPGFAEYKNVPESFEFTQIGGNPVMSYFATFLRGDQVMTEYFVRQLGSKGYVMFFTAGPLEEVRPIMPRVKAMAESVRLP